MFAAENINRFSPLFIMPGSYHMRCEYFPLFTHGICESQSECSASRQEGSYIGVLQQLPAQLLAKCIRGVHDTRTRVAYSLQSHYHRGRNQIV